MNKTVFSKLCLRKTGIRYMVLVFPCLLWFAPLAWATNWYVSQAGAGLKNGTSYGNAWSLPQLSTAWTNMQPGDTLYIVGCLNALSFSVGTSGTENNYVTVSGYDSNSGIDLTYNKSSTLFTGPDAYGAYSYSYTQGGSIYGFAEWTTLDGHPWNWTELTKETKVPDATWAPGSAYYGNGVLYWKPLGGIIEGKTISAGTSNAFYLNGKNWVKVTNLKIYGGRVNVGSGGHSENVWLDHLTVDGLNGGILIQVYDCDHVRLSYSTIKNGVSGLWNLGGDDDFITIDHNTFTNFTGDQDSHCIGLYDGGSNWLIEHNDLSYANTGITAYGMYLSNNVIRHNNIHHMEGSRASGGGGRGYGIGWEGNIVTAAYCNAHPEICSYTVDGHRANNLIYGNIVHHCTGTGGGMLAFGINMKFSDASNQVYNNTVYDCSPNYYISNIQIDSVTQPTAGTFKNNISYEPNDSSGASYLKHIMVGANTNYSGFTIDNNLYYPDTGTLFYVAPYPYAWNFVDWKTKLSGAGIMGGDLHSAVTDPLFTKASGTYSLASDFRPASGSPAINRGDNALWSGKPSLFDFTGSTRITDDLGKIIAPGNVVDIGAYEQAAVWGSAPQNLR